VIGSRQPFLGKPVHLAPFGRDGQAGTPSIVACVYIPRGDLGTGDALGDTKEAAVLGNYALDPCMSNMICGLGSWGLQFRSALTRPGCSDSANSHILLRVLL
jgi:hypothetical protein